MSPIRYRDDESSSLGTILSITAGALAGFAVGVFVAQRMGGLSGIGSRLRTRFGAARDEEPDYEQDEFEEDEEEYAEEPGGDSLEERVLEAFRHDPILSARGVDISEIGDGIIELSGSVETEDEAHHAVTVARGVPDVETVVNRITIGEEERLYEENARRVRGGDPALTEARWEGQGVGTGRRRQGTSADVDRHADPKAELEERWLRAEEALRNAADDTSGLAERRRSTKAPERGDRTGGSPISPTGVPKGDHVANPDAAGDEMRAD